MADAGGQLSADGQWWWDGTRWCSAISPDGTQQWDGTEWVVRELPGGTPSAPTPPRNYQFALDLDHSPYGDGKHPDGVSAGDLPPDARFNDGTIAVGPGWFAARAVLHWRCLGPGTVTSIAVVGPPAAEVMTNRSFQASMPDLAVRDGAGHVIRKDVSDVTPNARSAILACVGPGTEVTRAAEGFLAYGYLPGNWSKKYQFGFWRF